MTDEVVVPRWQPDGELSACSICGNAFTFLNRRHHCRRCGRLVCGPCSPHRITIPRQYIVHPPEEEALNPDGSTRSRSSTGPPNYPENPALGGGETVRVCNPCVPDPNYGPPPQQQEEQRSPPPSIRSRQTTCQSAPHNARTLSDFSGTPPQSTDRRGSYRPQLHTARYQALNSVPQRPRSSTQGLRTRSDNDTAHLSRSRYRSTSYTPTTVAAAHAAKVQMQQPQGREVLSEEDECPVCGTRNHPFGTDDTSGTSEEREQHVQFCISSHLAGPSHGGAPAEITNHTAPVETETASVGSVPQQAASMLGANSARQRMLVYHATEKDCFDEDGQAQECVICFEEFEEGAEMGRLECLCKFHRACIKGWMETRGRGTCPTHQLHD
ncbi:FYVE-domain-containing protein [Aureobasidium sp. EXF-10727]|nr:FYVE-domain-containing protein [Aureobasidium sp. EXF-10727]